MTEIVQYQQQTALTDVMDYARAVSTATMLPDNYRGKPADIMLAVGLGQSMGLSPAESLYRIAVIKGKPTASAELIAANVRKAGHKLRVRGDDTTCTASIFRADDPDFEFTVTRDLKWAQGMGLADQPNYRKQPGTMLQWRAITAVARLACPEALYGVQYTPDEIDPGDRPARTSVGGLGAALAPQVTAEQVTEPSGAEGAPGVAAPVSEPATSAPESPLLDPRSSLAKAMFAAMRERGIDDKGQRLDFCSQVTGREITTSAELTEDEARLVLRNLDPKADQ